MSYIALYRKYRPIIFNDIIGQENITAILKNQIKNKKISHAYIFSGSRGTGKTSAAKIFSRAINCLNPQDGEPCNECNICTNILNGNTTDVIEMDAASNNSVENIRQIKQEVAYATIDVKYRVYIIDEAHMLTTSAFNALLKTLEEPPENVVFILATTEQHKIPVTILSRCLRFDFGRISEEDIVLRLKRVLEEENIKYEEEAITYIAKIAEGGLRDALSVLDRCTTEIRDMLKYEDVLKIIGAIDREVVLSIVKAIEENDTIIALEQIDSLVKSGKDMRQLVSQLNQEVLDVLINLTSTNDTDKALRTTKIINRLSLLDNELKQTSKPVIVLKACIVELTTDIGLSKISTNINDEILLNKIDELSRKILELEFKMKNIKLDNTSNANKISKVELSNNIGESKRTITQTKNQNIETNISEDIDMNSFKDTEGLKKHIVERGKLKVYSALAGANIYETSDSLVIHTANSFACDMLKLQDSIDVIKGVLQEEYSKELNIQVKYTGKPNTDSRNNIVKVEKVLKDSNIEYIEID